MQVKGFGMVTLYAHPLTSQRTMCGLAKARKIRGVVFEELNTTNYLVESNEPQRDFKM